MAGSGEEKAVAAVQNKKVVLRRHVAAGRFPTEDAMEITVVPTELRVPAGLTAVLVKNLYLSCDPWMRGRMTKHDDGGVPPDFVLGEALVNFTVGKVVDSTHPEFNAGDLVWGMSAWEEYTLITHTEYLNKINHNDLPLSYYTGVLGVTGLTAYVGLFEVGKPKKGDFVFVSSASGAVGQVVGQLAKIVGLLHMRHRGRVAVCGMISQYNLEEPEGLRNLFCVIPKSVRVEGFNVGGWYHVYARFEEEMAGYIKDEKVAVVEDVVEGIESAPAALIGLFSGRNVGKQLVAIANA